MELEKLSAAQLGRRVNNKELKPIEVIDYFADRIEKRNPSINAFTYTKIEEARKEADLLGFDIMRGNTDNPFAGVPVGLKDFLPTKKGWPASHGGVKSYQTIDSEDGAIYSGMHNLGCIAIGKTNAPAFGFRATTDNKMYGPTSTPFKVGYNSGGSSGGSAAAVADGLVCMAEFGDAGGSGRIPAAWCGIFGYKPSAGVVPSVCRPDAWTATHPYCGGGVGTRTVEDAAYLFDAVRKFDLRDPLSVPMSFSPAVYELGESIKHLKVGYTLDFDLFAYPEPEIVDSLMKVVEMLSHEVSQIKPVHFKFNYSRAAMEDAWLRGINIDDATNPIVQKLIKEHPEDLPEALIKWSKIALESTMYDYLNFHKIRTDILDAHVNAFEDCDIIISPVSSCLPVKNSDDGDTKGPDYINGQKVDPLIGYAQTFLQNMVGFPAASVPCGLSADGLPIGLHVVAKRYDDNTMFRFASALEKLNPWDYTIPYSRII